jgi:O-acetyl-ADP-ribose deacetylase (regulator of RNase III)
MAVTVCYGDLLQAGEDIIGHQVNCQGVMGSGIAKTLRDAYPNLYSEYKRFADQHHPRELLGKCQLVEVGSKLVANLFGQLTYGRDNIRYTDYGALKQSLLTLKERARSQGDSVALPYNIGCGLANGDWKVVEAILQEVFIDYDVTLYQL